MEQDSSGPTEGATCELVVVALEDVVGFPIKGVAVASTTLKGPNCTDWAEEQAEASESVTKESNYGVGYVFPDPGKI